MCLSPSSRGKCLAAGSATGYFLRSADLLGAAAATGKLDSRTVAIRGSPCPSLKYFPVYDDIPLWPLNGQIAPLRGVGHEGNARGERNVPWSFVASSAGFRSCPSCGMRGWRWRWRRGSWRERGYLGGLGGFPHQTDTGPGSSAA